MPAEPVRPDGVTSYSMIQLASDSGNAVALVLFLFDLLYLDRADLLPRPHRQDHRRRTIGPATEKLPSSAPCGFRAGLHQLGEALIRRGTKGSNPALSSGESGANLTFSIRPPKIRTPCLGAPAHPKPPGCAAHARPASAWACRCATRRAVL